MKREDYIKAIEEYQKDLKDNSLSNKNVYDEQTNQNIFKICRKILRTNVGESSLTSECVNYKDIPPFFISSLKIFNSPLIIDYFRDKVRRMEITRKKSIDESGIEIEYKKYKNIPTFFKMTLPEGQLTMSGQMGYAHEMGHVPALDEPREDFLEYEEAIPMFLEYLIALRKKNDKENAFDYFLEERLPMEYEEARSILCIYKYLYHRSPLVAKYHQQEYIDNYKHIESLEYALQLIDRMNEDRKAVGNELEGIISGKPIKKVAESLGIVTDGCERLQQEYKRMSR